MSGPIANAQIAAFLVIKQDRKEIVRQHAAYDFGDIGEQSIEIEGLRRGGRDFQQEIEQLRTLAKTNGCFTRRLHGRIPGGATGGAQAAVASTIFTLALAPIRVAPAAVMARKIFQRAHAARSFDAHFRPDHAAHQSDIVARLRRRC